MDLKNCKQVWDFIVKTITTGDPVFLLYVVQSSGSSPGREGFHLATSTTECCGTIGGGVMEYKLVELARNRALKGYEETSLIPQYHDKSHTTAQSGMICSGHQHVVMIPLNANHLALATKIASNCAEQRVSCIEIDVHGIHLRKDSSRQDFIFNDELNWKYTGYIGKQPRIHIIGAGHVSLALSELMAYLGFYIIVYDDREELNTLQRNAFANEKRIVDYERIRDEISIDEQDYVVIMTIGYRPDKVVLESIIDVPCKYLGMLGSSEKIRVLFAELRDEGFSEKQLSRVHTPIGLPIHSKTAGEIAVSIAGQIILTKNT